MNFEQRIKSITLEILSEDSLDGMQNKSLKTAMLGAIGFVAVIGLGQIAPSVVELLTEEGEETPEE